MYTIVIVYTFTKLSHMVHELGFELPWDWERFNPISCCHDLWYCTLEGWWEPLQFLLYLKLSSSLEEATQWPVRLKCKKTFQRLGLHFDPARDLTAWGRGWLSPSHELHSLLLAF